MDEPAAAPLRYIPSWTLGDRFRKARRVAGVGQAEFAQMLGTNQKTYASWEIDKSAPRHTHLMKIAQEIEAKLGIPATWIVGFNAMTAELDYADAASAGADAGLNISRCNTRSRGTMLDSDQVTRLPVRGSRTAARLANDRGNYTDAVVGRVA